MKSITVSQKKRGRPATGEMPRLGVRLPAEVIEALKLHATMREMSVSEALRDLIQTSIGALSEYDGSLRPIVLGLNIDEIATLDRIRGELSRPDMIRALLAVFSRDEPK